MQDAFFQKNAGGTSSPKINGLQTHWAYLPLLQEKDSFEVALSQKPLRFIPVAVCHTPKKSNRAVQKNVDTRITWFQTLPQSFCFSDGSVSGSPASHR